MSTRKDDIYSGNSSRGFSASIPPSQPRSLLGANTPIRDICWVHTGYQIDRWINR